MQRILPALTVTAFLALLSISMTGIAAAGDYSYERTYDDGYRYSGYRYGDYRYRPRSYNSDCCYRRVVRYKKIYRDYDRPYYSGGYDPYYSRRSYVTTYYDDVGYSRPYYTKPYYSSRPYYTTRYYDDGYRRPHYHSRPYYSTRYDDYRRPYYHARPYNGTSYYGPRYHSTSYSNGGNYWRYADQPRRFYVPACNTIRYKVYDNLGGWVWATRKTC